eukprot:CAMPEP_0179173072 /NCGR_PEP_ID=MMETSP0796-20121207/85389_1 /TAXON_ID=73915 /ORGANISM="Pyrodinium bahamense, Strain pbaha01" /LENGTH=48 /DNA_ID= /DNA_START= /DNA_END= /DNA_ORIENTATION=
MLGIAKPVGAVRSKPQRSPGLLDEVLRDEREHGMGGDAHVEGGEACVE